MKNEIRVINVCEENMCCGCYACVDICPKGAIHIEDTLKALNAKIDNEKCIDCGLCYKVCPNNTTVEGKLPIEWRQGWALDEEIRQTSSSGGVAQAISKAFVNAGGIVWSCVFENGEFSFSYAKTIKEVEKFRGSKYVKSTPSGMYKLLLSQLKAGYKILFIGLPCQSAGLQNYVGDRYQKSLYTIDLICHGSPSQEILKQYLSQSFKIDIREVGDIQFRTCNNFGLNVKYTSLLPPRVRDRYTEAFLKGYIYTENCYSCKYAKTLRVSDITLGDSWGTELTFEEQHKGISLVLCQTIKGQELLEISKLYLVPANIEKAIAGNEQLQHPHNIPKQRERVFDLIDKKKSLKKAMFFTNPSLWIKQDIKYLMAKLGLLGGGMRLM